MDLAHLLQQPEGKTLECKRDLSSPDRVLHTLLAFANTAGGTLVVGVDDRTKHVRGIADSLKEEERLANLVSDSILPRPGPEYRDRPLARHAITRRRNPSQLQPSAPSEEPGARKRCVSRSG